MKLRVQSLEALALDAVRSYARGERSLNATMEAVGAYDQEQARLSDGRGTRAARLQNYRRTLADRPWAKCGCRVCKEVGVEVVIFRGNNRNRRRGFHNVQEFYRTLRSSQRMTRDAIEQTTLGLQ